MPKVAIAPDAQTDVMQLAAGAVIAAGLFLEAITKVPLALMAPAFLLQRPPPGLALPGLLPLAAFLTLAGLLAPPIVICALRERLASRGVAIGLAAGAILAPLLLAAPIHDLQQQRARAVAAFRPDELFTNSLWASLRNAPDEPQVFLHAGAMKDCRPYAWSWREMSFYELSPRVAVM